MAINDADLLAAVTGGIESTPSTATTTPETNNDADDTDALAAADGDADESGESGDAADSKSAEDGSDVGADDSGDADASEDEELGPDGKPVAKAAKKPEEVDDTIDPATGQPYTAEQIAAKKVEADKAEKAAFAKQQVEDPINAPIPKYLKETTQKRMVALVDIAKDLTAKVDSAMKDRNEIIGMITETGANAMQYRGVLNYLSLVNSGEPAKIQQAISVMQKELEVLSRAAGIHVPGVDHLAEHPDLIAEVAAGKLTAQRAQELALTRNRSAFHAQRQTEYAETTQQATQRAKDEHAKGVADLNEIGKALEKAEGVGYRAKAKLVLASIKADLEKSSPLEWGQKFLVAYTTHKAPAVVVPVVKKPAVPKNQPLRGNNPSGGQQKAPASLEEAINFGIAAGTRR